MLQTLSGLSSSQLLSAQSAPANHSLDARAVAAVPPPPSISGHVTSQVNNATASIRAHDHHVTTTAD